MALDAFVELAGAAVRFVARMAFELIVERLMYGTGRAVLWPFYRRKPPNDDLCLVVGIGFWILVAFAFAIGHSGPVA
ncbi:MULTISPECIES: hypothetical protein [Lysobacter]|jgi:hypothetical protein|uniref:hypothetical protein n=1 Tax=Lysobacter TaxID=68 RepID=UPI001F45E475|nr:MULTISPECIES: hypothetical protein [Lysobacter]UJB17825.1 hypothetical protein L1A79_15825 [Lysobacter capsici]UJQ28453.1 hypothetical protein L2D09_24065 [Lysobacter gummosus]